MASMNSNHNSVDSKKPLIYVNVISDVICPWCWMAKKKLEKAIQMVKEEFRVEVRWEPFQLRPGISTDGEISPGAGQAVEPRLARLGESVGVHLKTSPSRIPNSLHAQALLEYAKQWQNGTRQNELYEIICKAYFLEDRFLDVNTLVSLATQCGLDGKEVRQYITEDKTLDRVKEKARYWTRQGIRGVPYFYMNGQRTFSGAQDPDAFVKMFQIIHEKYPIPVEIYPPL